MDQDAFRKLLAQPRAGGAQSTTSRPSLIKKVDASQPIFAPRTAKPSKAGKAGGSDQQAKRAGLGFKKSSKPDGDGPSSSASGRVFNDDDMPPPVKGLDFAALELAKKQAAAEADDLDDVLEETYKTSGAAPDLPPNTATATTALKKRTRDDLIKELKAKRQKTGDGADAEAKTLEDAKKQGKFRPIGAPAPKETKVKKKKKVKPAPASISAPTVEQQESSAAPSKPEPERAAAKQPARAPEPQPEPEEDLGDMDLFDGVEEYKGLDEDEDEGEDGVEASHPARDASPTAGNAKWFELDDGLGTLPAPPARPPTPPPVERVTERDRSPDEPDRLAPLASSSFSIKDVLAMDQELEKEEKRRAKKEKKKKEGGGGGEKPKMSTEAKVNRDLQKLESYTSKKRG